MTNIFRNPLAEDKAGGEHPLYQNIRLLESAGLIENITSQVVNWLMEQYKAGKVVIVTFEGDKLELEALRKRN